MRTTLSHNNLKILKPKAGRERERQKLQKYHKFALKIFSNFDPAVNHE
jgi:hypothetical protein